MATLQIPNHAHCQICSQAVPFGDKTCSAECERKLDELQKKRRRTVLFLYGLMGASVLILLLGSMGGGFGF